jgi:hypothetical protein
MPSWPALVTLLAALVVPSGSVTAQTANTPDRNIWGDLMLAGGVRAARDIAGLGSGDGRVDAGFLLDFARRFGDSGATLALGRMGAHLRNPATARTPAFAVPLPLPDFWRTMSGDTSPTPPVLRTRAALLTYHGLMALDDDSLAAFAAMPRFVRWIATTEAAAAIFATSARSLRFKTGTIRLAGGDDTGPIWSRLAGEDAQQPERFLQALLTRDRGRLACFYDAIGSLPRARQLFALGAHLPVADRPAFVQGIYRAFLSVEPTWDMTVRPFYRPDFDGLIALLATEVRSDNTVGPDWWPALFERVGRGGEWPSDERRAEPSGARPTPADARWLAEWVFADRDAARGRFEALRFAQRVFPDSPREQTRQLETALRGVVEMPALLFGLERMGVRNPETYASLVTAARFASDHGNVPATVRWQAALALVEQAQRRNAWPEDRLTPLLLSWAAAAPIGADRLTAAADWVVESLVPALVEGPTDPDSLEVAFVRAATTSNDARTVQWEGLAYTTDPSRAATMAALALRDAEDGPRLQHLVQAQRARAALGAASRGADPSAVLEALRGLEQELSALPDAGGLDPGLLRRVRRSLDDVDTARGGTVAPRDGAYAELAEAIADRVLPSLAYALALAPTTEPGLYAMLWRRHVVAEGRADAGNRALAAWQVPRNAAQRGGVSPSGSYLALDVALAGAQFVRVISGTPTVRQVVAESDRAALAEALVVPAADDRPGAAAYTLAALEEGRRRVAAWSTDLPSRAELAAGLMNSGVDPWRANALGWQAQRDGAATLAHLTLDELLRVGGNDRLGPAEWSSSMRPVDGCLCRSGGRTFTSDVTRGRRLGIRALGTLDPALRLAELLAMAGLDTALVTPLLPMALQDWLDRSESAWIDDVDAFSSWPATLTAVRLEEYMLEAVATGRLAPPATEADR